MGIDDGSNGVCGVVETIDEFEAERDDERYEQQDEGQVGRDLRAGLVDIDIKAVGHEQEPGRQDAEEKN
jgi:hypothetical protein